MNDFLVQFDIKKFEKILKLSRKQLMDLKNLQTSNEQMEYFKSNPKLQALISIIVDPIDEANLLATFKVHYKAWLNSICIF
jgi:hypothetical protein